MKPFLLYRRRLIPNECVLLGDDKVISFQDHRLVTVWNAIRPKKNLHHGISAFFFDDGIKISKFYRADGSLTYWYIDIIRADLYYPETADASSPDDANGIIRIPDRPYDISFENYPIPTSLDKAQREGILSPIETAERLYHRTNIRISAAPEKEVSGLFPCLIVTDLLADILIYPDGFVKVVDLDEISRALEEKMLTVNCVSETLRILDKTLGSIYDGTFIEKQDYLKSFE